MFKNILPPVSAATAENNPYAAPTAPIAVAGAVAGAPSQPGQVFQVDFERERALHRRQLGLRAVSFLPFLGVLAWYDATKRGRDVAFPMAIFVAAYLWRVWSRSSDRLELAQGYALEVGATVVRRSTDVLPTITLRRDDIRSVSHLADGAFVLVGPTLDSSILVPGTVVGRDALLETLRTWAPAKRAQTAIDGSLGILLPLSLFLFSAASGSVARIATCALVIGLSARGVWSTWKSPVLTRSRQVIVTIGFAFIIRYSLGPLLYAMKHWSDSP